MEPLYNYKAYSIPKVGLFKIDTNEYGQNGWIMIEERKAIIGECDEFYVERLHETQKEEWIEGELIKTNIILPLGIHKSRFIKWVVYQMTLF